MRILEDYGEEVVLQAFKEGRLKQEDLSMVLKKYHIKLEPWWREHFMGKHDLVHLTENADYFEGPNEAPQAPARPKRFY